MKETDNELLVAQFFKDNAFDLPDNGFSERVINRLPKRRLWLSRAWTFICFWACVAFVLLSDVKQQLQVIAQKFMNELSVLAPDIHLSWSFLLVVALVLLTFQWIMVHAVATYDK